MEWQLFVGCFAITIASFMAGFKIAMMLSRKAVKHAKFSAKLIKTKYNDEVQYARTSWF